jgi:hypothetical protein
MTTKLLVIVLLIYVSSLLISFSANEKKSLRYRQGWVVAFAAVFASTILLLDAVLPTFIEEVIINWFPALYVSILSIANVVLFVVFVSTKSSGKMGIKAIRWLYNKLKNYDNKTNQKLLNGLTIFYEKHLKKAFGKGILYDKRKNETTLRHEWVFLRKVCQMGALFSGTILFLSILSYKIDSFAILSVYLPRFPVLSFIIFLELYWLLDGRLPLTEDEKVAGKKVDFHIQTNYNSLYEEYRSKWNTGILTDSQLDRQQNRSESFQFDKLTENVELQTKIKQICSRLKKEDIQISESNVRILKDLLEEKDVLIVDAHYEQIKPFLFSAVETILIKNKKIIVLSCSDPDSVTSWLKDGMNNINGLKYFWNIAHIEDIMEQNLDYDIMIMNPIHLLDEQSLSFIKKEQTTSKVESVMILEAEKLLAHYSTPLHTFMYYLQDITNVKTQLILLSKWNEDLEHHIRSLFFSNPSDTYASLEPTNNLYYIVWKSEETDYLQHEILPKVAHRKIDLEAVLAIPAMQSGVQTIRFIDDQKLAIQESTDHLTDVKGLLPNVAFKQNLKENLNFHQNQWSVPMENDNFLVIHDFERNFVNVLTQFWGVATENSFIHIVSPPYLLRDYLSNNLSFFLENTHKISPISVRLSDFKSRLARTLIERLSHSYLTEEEVVHYLKQAKVNSPSTIEGIKELFKETFGDNRRLFNAINVQFREEFQTKDRKFITEKYYNLLLNPNEERINNWYSFYKLITADHKILDTVLVGHAYQNYLPGQMHAWDGKMYQITSIDQESKKIHLSYEAPKRMVEYRQDRAYILNAKPKSVSLDEFTINQYQFTFEHCEVPFHVETHGYYQFEHGIDLMGDHLKYVPLKELDRKESKRSYHNGNVLKINIKKELKLKKINVDRVAFTLSFLLNELFRSLYPYSYQYIAVCSPMGSLKGKLEHDDSQFNTKLMQLIPNLVFDEKTENKNELNIYIFEDSPMYLGVIESIKNAWMHIIEILDDYVHWLIEENEDEEKNKRMKYISLGYNELPEYFALEETAELLSKWIPKDNLRKIRASFYNSQSITSRIEQNDDHGEEKEIETSLSSDIRTEICDLCQIDFPATQFIQLDDGRKRCSSCHYHAVDKTDDIETLYATVRKTMVEHFAITLRNRIDIVLIDPDERNMITDIDFIPKETEDLSTRNLDISLADNKATIYIEKGIKKENAIARLAHELTHIWQFDFIINVHYQSTEDIEGHAAWTEIQMLELLGEKRAARKLSEDLEYENTLIANGYRKLSKALEENPYVLTPFELFNQNT